MQRVLSTAPFHLRAAAQHRKTDITGLARARSALASAVARLGQINIAALGGHIGQAMPRLQAKQKRQILLEVRLWAQCHIGGSGRNK